MKTFSDPLQSSCERLTVQKVQAIQPSGIFLAIDPNDLKIKYISSNCESLIKLNPHQAIGASLDLIFSSHSIRILSQSIVSMKALSPFGRIVIPLDFIESGDKVLRKACLIYSTETLLYIETQLEAPSPSTQTDTDQTDTGDLDFECLLQGITQFKGSIEKLATLLCSQIRKITQFDRVYYCEFGDDGHGYVPADDTNELLNSFINHHFPASDLPMVVRELYVKNRFRMIPDAQYNEVPILGVKDNLDLGQSLFRVISPTHLQYLKNMGVRGSSSFSVVDHQTLRGLVGCHSVTPKSIPLSLLPKIQILVEAFTSKVLAKKEPKQKAESSKPSLELFNFVSAYEECNCDLGLIPSDILSNIREAFEAQTILCFSEVKVQTDPILSADFSNFFVSFAKGQLANTELTVTDELLNLSPEFENWKSIASGTIFISLNPDQSSFIALFRPEILQTHQWGGNPDAGSNLVERELGPRNSFTTWIKQVTGKCKPWSLEDVSLAKRLRQKILSIQSNHLNKVKETNRQLVQKNKEIETLLSEVHHRVKNNLAIVSSIFDWKIRDSTSAEVISSFKEMKSRIRAISTLHQTLYQGNHLGSVNLARYLRAISYEVLALVHNGKSEISFKIEMESDLFIPISDALPIGLISHEFITNSTKYAFVGRDTGEITLQWQNQKEGVLFTLSDNGLGCVEIETLKGSSLGLQLIKLLIGQINGQASWSGSNGVTLKIQLEGKYS